MISGQFLRRIELDPSKDLQYRRDLLELQITSSLATPIWENLCYPDGEQNIIKFRQEHVRYQNWYLGHIGVTNIQQLFNLNVPISCKNRQIYMWCLINRCRYEANYPLITFKEEEWVKYTTLMIEPLFKAQLQAYLDSKLRIFDA